MEFRPPLVLKYQEAVHVASFLRRLVSWDARAVVRIQSRNSVAGLWGVTPMGCLAFIAVPLGEAPDPAIDTIVSAGRVRDILGDLSQCTDSNREVAYRLPDEMPVVSQLTELPPQGAWIPADRLAACQISELVDDAVAEYHKQAEMFPSADRKFLDHLAEQVWARPGVATFPLKSLHAARQLGFLSHPNARVEFATLDGWKRLVTPAGQIFINTRAKRPKLRVV
jgi:hypothetical protein